MPLLVLYMTVKIHLHHFDMKSSLQTLRRDPFTDTLLTVRVYGKCITSKILMFRLYYQEECTPRQKGSAMKADTCFPFNASSSSRLTLKARS